MPLPGEASAKVGNRYELYWTVFCLLDVIEGRYDSIYLVPPGDEGHGIEFYLCKDKLTRYHQAKRQNGKSGKWTIAELDNAGVLSALHKKLSVLENSFVFVSMDSAGELRELAYRAERSKDWEDFQNNFISAQSQAQTFNNLCSYLGSTSQEATYEQLKRVEVRTIDEDFLLRTILDRAKLYFSEPQQAVEALIHLVIASEHLELSKEKISKTLIERGVRYLDIPFEHDEVKTFSENHRYYLFNLITQLEERKGVSEYIELSGQSEWVEVNQSGEKNQPPKSWEPEFTLLEPKKKDTETLTVTRKSKLESIQEAAEKFDQFVLIGEPGAGKSTILRRFCLEAARLCLADFGNTPIPLLLDLPSWKGETTPEDFIIENWGFEGDPLRLLAEGKVKLYLDGLNEMGASGLLKAQQLKRWIHSLDASGKPTTNSLKPKMVVITCRSLDYGGDLNLELPVIRLEELSDEKIKSFVYNYLSESAEKFLGRVLSEADDSQEDARHLLDLSRNPYMLASLVYLFEQSPDGELPQNTGTLFQRLVETLWLREGFRGTHNNLPVSEIQYPLARLAFSMIDSDMPTSTYLDYAMFYLGDEKYLQLAQRASFLIVNGNRVQFYHQLMQEYFAAVGLSSVGVSHIQINQMLRQVETSFFATPSFILSSKWDQVAIALCGITNNPEEVIARIATINPSLAQRCLSSGVDVNEMSIIPSLLDALKNEDETIRRDAVHAIGNSAKTDELVPVLITALKDSNRSVRQAAVNALGRLGNLSITFLTAELRRNDDVTKSNVQNALVNIGDAVVPSVLDLLGDNNPEVVKNCISILGALKSHNSVESLMRQMQSTNESIRIASVTALGGVDDLRAFRQVTAALGDTATSVRIAAIEALASSGTRKTVTSRLAKIINNESDNLEVREKAIDTLGRLDPKAALPHLIKCLKSQEPQIHNAAYRVLEYLRTERKIRRAGEATRIFRDLRYQDYARRKAAFERLRKEFGPRGFLLALNKSYSGQTFWNISHALVDLPTEDTSLLIQALNTLDSSVRKGMVINALGERQEKETGKYLIPLLSNESAYILGLTVEALGSLKYEPAVPAIIAKLNDTRKIFSNSNQTVRDAAIGALKAIATVDALEALRHAHLEEKVMPR